MGVLFVHNYAPWSWVYPLVHQRPTVCWDHYEWAGVQQLRDLLALTRTHSSPPPSVPHILIPTRVTTSQGYFYTFNMADQLRWYQLSPTRPWYSLQSKYRVIYTCMGPIPRSQWGMENIKHVAPLTQLYSHIYTLVLRWLVPVLCPLPSFGYPVFQYLWVFIILSLMSFSF